MSRLKQEHIPDGEMTQTPPIESLQGRANRWVAQSADLALLVAGLILLLVLVPVAAQNGQGTQRPVFPQPISPGPNGNQDDIPAGGPLDNEKLLRTLNSDRQKSMVADTNKLVRLVNELNAEIANNNPDSLTPEQLRKVAEIEKLAHNVKEKMSTSVRGTPAFQQPHFPLH
jgi:hypothetical protein